MVASHSGTYLQFKQLGARGRKVRSSYVTLYLKTTPQIIFKMYGCFACMSFCALCTYRTCGGQKSAFDSLGIKLQMAVSYQVGAGTQTQCS